MIFRTLSFSGFCFLASVLCFFPAARAQDIMKDAVASFPPQTIRVEYSRPAKLRTLPDYESLRRRYAGPGLRALENNLSKLGVEESDIDELVLGWRSRSESLDLLGLAGGRFDPASVASHAVASRLKPIVVEGSKTYCFGSEATSPCVAVLDETRGALGTLNSLTALLQARQGRSPSLSSDSHFTALADEARSDSPIWGIATGAAVADWFKGWMPTQKDLELDWSQAFQNVSSLIYSVDAADKVRLNVKMACTTPQAAADLNRIFQGMKLFQQLAWQRQNPNRPNPFEDLAIDNRGQQVTLALTTVYAALEGAAFGN